MRTLDNSSSLFSFIIIFGIGYLVLDVVVVLFILNGGFGVLDVVFRTKGVGLDGDLAFDSFRLVGDSSTGVQSEIVDPDVFFFFFVFDFDLVVCVLIDRSNACNDEYKCSKFKKIIAKKSPSIVHTYLEKHPLIAHCVWILF